MLQGIKRAQVQQEWVFWLHATLKKKKKRVKPVAWRRFWRSYFVHIIGDTLQVPCIKQCNHTQMTFGNYYQCTDTLNESQREVGRFLTGEVTEQKAAKQFVVLKKYARDVKDNGTLCLPAKSESIVIARDLKTSAVYFALQYTTTFVHLAAKKGLAKSKQGGWRKIESVRERRCWPTEMTQLP